MIRLKSAPELALMKTGGAMLADVLEVVGSHVRPGITTQELDKIAEEEIEKKGGTAGFKRVKGYNWASCMCVNEQVVHTPPSNAKLIDGDILTFDIGVFYKGFHTDAARTVIVGEATNKEHEDFLQSGREALLEGLKMVKKGNNIGHISQAIESVIKRDGYYIIKELTGHGVGRDLHEDPFIPGYVSAKISHTPAIVEGMALAVEVIYAMGCDDIGPEKGNSWSLITKDKSVSACFEDTIIVEHNNTSILTGNYGKI